MDSRSRERRSHLSGVAPPTANALVRRAIARVRASVWIGVAGRSLLLVLALVVLAGIGRAAASTSLAPTVTTAADAGGETPIASASPPAIASAPPPPPPQPSPASHARATADDPVFVNHASIDELCRLPGVGPKRANAILALRQRVGHFRRVEELLRVKGVGRASIRKWRPLIRLDAPPAASDAGAAP